MRLTLAEKVPRRDIAAPRLAGIDGLRGVAAIAVFCVHFNQVVRFDERLGPFELSWVFARGDHGVLVFFVLSGFLLSIPFFRASAHGAATLDLRVYAVRRLLRILPAYYLALTLLVILSGLWRAPAAWWDIILHYALVFNYTEFSIFSINPPFWTLAVEMQFYLLLPLLMIVVGRFRDRGVFVALLCVAATAYVCHYWVVVSVDRLVEWPFNKWQTWIRPFGAVVTHSLLAHFPHFLFGVAAAWAFTRTSDAGGAKRKFGCAHDLLFWMSAIFAFGLVSTGLGERLALPYGRYGFPLIPALVAIMIFAAPNARSAGIFLESVSLRAFGQISYGFYIYHWPSLAAVDRLMLERGLDAAEHWLLFGAAGFGLAVALSVASYFVIERPAIQAARRYRRNGVGAA